MSRRTRQKLKLPAVDTSIKDIGVIIGILKECIKLAEPIDCEFGEKSRYALYSIHSLKQARRGFEMFLCDLEDKDGKD